jgi:hypothetical protein
MRTRSRVTSSLVVVVTALLLVGASSRRAEACSCVVPTVENGYNNSTDVVTAAVSFGFRLGGTQYYFARVQRVFKGCLDADDWVVLKTPTDGAACGVDLSLRRYLLNAHADGQQFGLPALRIGLCGYNHLVSDLSEEDLAFLDGRTVCCGDECACADGSQPVQCFVDPCSVAPECSLGECVANYCGGCNAEFYNTTGDAVCGPGDSECFGDEDCSSGEWCRAAPPDGSIYECVPFVGDGERCNGFTTPWNYEQCEAGLTCDTPDFVADAPGICRGRCPSQGCGNQGYCAADGLCDDDGACERDVDCNLLGNDYAHIECVGHGVCDASGRCGWECGDPQCLDLGGYDFGACDALLGWGVENGVCAQLSGCSSGPFPLFETLDACVLACTAQ